MIRPSGRLLYLGRTTFQQCCGDVLLYKDGVAAKRLKFSVTPTTFELLGVTFTFGSSSLVVVAAYRSAETELDAS